MTAPAPTDPAATTADHTDRTDHTDDTDLAERYVACWNATDPTVRRDLLARHWVPDATYVDPVVEVAGLDQLDATIAAVQAQFPGFVFTTIGPVDAHHASARFRWGLGPAGAEPVVEGSDVVRTAADGRIAAVTGFLDRVPGQATTAGAAGAAG